ncbi:MAG: hypothetical protein CMB16_00440 [Euryarchaeota archaeon]|jgi:hypothetical protein|nr:hypothetical protein [Euryarchaeota archaeon]|tara:strand:- start:8534 stop:8944 length:411 start_codon:yes stop_codon:yes gene_type:complete
MLITNRKGADMVDFNDLYVKADLAGVKAGNDALPTPMVVGSPTTPLGDDIDPKKPMYFVNDGVCGFAWVNIKPARGKFITWLKSMGIGRKDSYYGGYTIWVSGFGQSYERKNAYANAFAKVLNDNGIKAYAMGRLD